MADYISMKQVPNGTVTAVDDRILYDYMMNSGIIYGCEISYLGNNMIHINAGYGVIKGGLFEMEDHTEYVEYAENANELGQIYLHFDAAAEDKLTIVCETNSYLHPMTQNANANYTNGVYEIQLCTFTATTTSLKFVTQTFQKSVVPVDVIDTLEGIIANTTPNKSAGAKAVKELNTIVSAVSGVANTAKTNSDNAISQLGSNTLTYEGGYYYIKNPNGQKKKLGELDGTCTRVASSVQSYSAPSDGIYFAYAFTHNEIYWSGYDLGTNGKAIFRFNGAHGESGVTIGYCNDLFILNKGQSIWNTWNTDHRGSFDVYLIQ